MGWETAASGWNMATPTHAHFCAVGAFDRYRVTCKAEKVHSLALDRNIANPCLKGATAR